MAFFRCLDRLGSKLGDVRDKGYCGRDDELGERIEYDPHVGANGYSLDTTSKSGNAFDYTKDLTKVPPVARTYTTPGGTTNSW